MRISNVKKKMMKNFLRCYKLEVSNEIERLQDKKHFNMVDWNKAKQVGDFKKIEEILYKKKELTDITNSN